MKVLVACEFSGTVRDAFIRRGHDAMSCDLLLSETEGPHRQGDIRDVLGDGWDLMIAHPPCTYLTVTGNKWMKPEFSDRFPDRQAQRIAAAKFFVDLAEAPIGRIAVENPVGVMSTLYRKPDQYIQPYDFGHPHSKKTCLWLKNLWPLVPTNRCAPQWHANPDGSIYRDSKGKRYSESAYQGDWLSRSRTYQGIADAMAEQWGS